MQRLSKTRIMATDRSLCFFNKLKFRIIPNDNINHIVEVVTNRA